MIVIDEPNISRAWKKLFSHIMEPGIEELSPVLITTPGVTVDTIDEDRHIRQTLDKALVERGKSSLNTVANTIFPATLWNRSRPRADLYKRYTEFAWPRIRKCPANNRGTYFQRFVAYVVDSGKSVNQLEHVIDTWNNHRNHRHSALQVAVFDPRRDHLHTRRLGFPCLHQVAFTPVGVNGSGGLAVTGFYATQHIFEKAYGNYLGLCRLGQFISHELGLKLVRMTCVTASAKLGNVGKTELSSVARELDLLKS
jgi:thymidylate synthase